MCLRQNRISAKIRRPMSFPGKALASFKVSVSRLCYASLAQGIFPKSLRLIAYNDKQLPVEMVLEGPQAHFVPRICRLKA